MTITESLATVIADMLSGPLEGAIIGGATGVGLFVFGMAAWHAWRISRDAARETARRVAQSRARSLATFPRYIGRV